MSDDGRLAATASAGVETTSATWTSRISVRRVLSVVVVLVVVAAVVPFAVYAVPQLVGAEYSFVVLSGSMSPSIDPGDAVIVGPQPPEAIETGDVITYHRANDDVPTTHRVIGVTETPDGYLYETKGDANEDPDSNPVPHENVLGSVVVSLPYVGHVVQFANTTLGFVTLVVFPIGLFLLNEVWSVVTSSRGEDTASSSSRGAGATPHSARDDDTASPSSPDADEPVDSSQASTDGFTLTIDHLTGATVVLAAFAPYSVYVAFQLQTAFAVSLAVGTSMCLLIAVGLRVVGSGDGAGHESIDESGGTDDDPADERTGTDVERELETGEVDGDDTADEADELDDDDAEAEFTTLDEDLKALLPFADAVDAPDSSVDASEPTVDVFETDPDSPESAEVENERPVADGTDDVRHEAPFDGTSVFNESNRTILSFDPSGSTPASADCSGDSNWEEIADGATNVEDESQPEPDDRDLPDIDWSAFEEIEERAR